MCPWKRGFLLSFNDCLYLSVSAWMLASFSLIWGPNFCLQTFCCRFLHSFFLPHTLSLLSPPPSFSFPPAWLAVFVSLHLNFAHLLSALMEGDIWRAAPLSCTRRWSGGGGTPGRRRNAIRRNICQAKRLHDRCSSKAQQEVLVEQKNHLQPETARRLWSSKAWCFLCPG